MTNAFADMGEQIITDFVTEAREMIEMVEPELLTAKQLDKNLANKIFRPIHTIKGIAGSFGFTAIAELAHNSESFLTLFREKEISSTRQNHLAVFLRTFDLIREILKRIEIEQNDQGFASRVSDIIDEFVIFTNELKTNPEVPQPQTAPPTPTPVIEVTTELEPAGSPAMVTTAADQNPTPASNKETTKNERKSALSVEISQDMLDAFKTESSESFGIIEQLLLQLISDPQNADCIHETFRQIHSFKGNCGIFGLHEFEKVAHKTETILSEIKHKRLKSEPAIFELIMTIIDSIKSALLSYTLGMEEINFPDVEKFIKQLNTFDPLAALHLFDEHPSEKKDSAPPASPGPEVIITADVESIAKPSAEMKSTITENSTPNAIKADKLSDEKTDKKVAVIETQKDIRVSTEKLDQLNNLMGELVTANTMLTANVLQTLEHVSINREVLEKSLNYLSKTVNDLQDVAVDIRMVPISGLFKKMMRIVHDLSIKSKKTVNLIFFGQETEIDKTLIEKIGDPLVHMVRNAIDHGIESEEDRIAAGKPKTGTLTLGAKQEAGEIWIIIEDDGKGLDKEKILQKALAMGMLKGDGSDLTDKQIYNLIFSAGLSTAAKITDISGRGVGMDVVQQNISELRGVVDIISQKGKGSQFIIKLPLTLAIIDGLLLQVSNVKYTMPVENILEIVKATKDDIDSIIQQQQCIMVRNQLIPVVVLSQMHNLKSECTTEEGILLVISSRGATIALLIDKILGQQQTVVKPVPKYFSGLRGISGCTILGDGEISLILDVGQIIDVAVAA